LSLRNSCQIFWQTGELPKIDEIAWRSQVLSVQMEYVSH
jgi:hypothetical protein